MTAGCQVVEFIAKVAIVLGNRDMDEESEKCETQKRYRGRKTRYE
jgi:hypothetical protein